MTGGDALGRGAHAHEHGRSLDEEIDLALAIHVANHGLAMLRDEPGKAEARAHGHDPDVDSQEFKAELARLCALAFEPSLLERGI